MKVKALLFAAAAAIFLAPQSASANGFYVPELGASATGLASAVVANPQDASANWFNPAGLPSLDGTLNLYAGFTWAHNATSFKPAGYETVDAEASNFFLPNFYVTYKHESGFAVGFGVNAPFGLGVTWPKGEQGKGTAIVANQVKSIQMFSLYFNPNVAYQIFDWLAVAAGFDFGWGNVQLNKELDFDSSRGGMEFSGNTMGFGGNVAVLVRPIKPLSIGMTYRSRMKLDLKDAKARFYDVPRYLRTQLPDGNLDSGLTMPDLLTLGVAYEPFENFVAEVDFNYNFWSVYDSLSFTFKKGRPEKQVFEKNWQNAMQLRVALSYAFKNLLPGNGALKVRAGYVFDQNPGPDDTIDPMLPDSNRNNVSFGVGVDMFGATVDLGYMLVMLVPREVGSENAVPGEYKNMIHLLSFNIGYRF